ncbi:MAG: hypothetical protein ACRDZ2_12950 [Ilumatobacteraceae bacterium]
MRLLGDRRDDDADLHFSDNVGADESYTRRAAAARELLAAHGRLQLQRVDASLATDATAVATTASERTVRVWFALAPTVEARVQDYSIEVAH